MIENNGFSLVNDKIIKVENLDDDEEVEKNILNRAQIIPQIINVKIPDSFDNQFDQIYYINKEGTVRLIFPYHDHFYEKNDCHNHPNNEKLRRSKYQEIR